MTSPSKDTGRVEPHARIALHAGEYEDGRFTVSFTWPYATPPSISLQQNFVICGNNAHDDLVRALEAAREFVLRHPALTETDRAEFDAFVSVPTTLSRIKTGSSCA